MLVTGPEVAPAEITVTVNESGSFNYGGLGHAAQGIKRI
jgi:hypothetical protein